MTSEIWLFVPLTYSQFHKTLPKSSLGMHWISVRFYEMGDTTKRHNILGNIVCM